MPALHQGKCTSKARLSSLRDLRGEYKDKLPDVIESHRNIRTPYNSKLK